MRLPGITYDSNLSFSRPERVRLAVLPPLAAGLMRLLLSSCRMDIREKGNVDQVVALHGHALIALWHESMLAACWISRNRNYHTLTSHSFDGEFAARVLNRFGIEAVRGSSSRGGGEGLRQMELAARQAEWVGITSDGPRGPRRVAKPGIGILAARTQLPVIPLVVVPVRSARLNSWDRLPIPFPFSRIICVFGEPVPPPRSDDRDHVEQTRLAVEQALNRLHEKIEVEAGVVA